MVSVLPAVLGGAALAGSAIQGSAAQSAASTQADASKYAADQMLAQYLQTRADLQPFTNAGQTATTALSKITPFNFAPFDFNPSQEDIENTPGYKFNLGQGLKSVQNSFAARGLGSSGAAMKGAAQFATGLADSTYQNQFANALSKYQQNFGTALQSYGTNVGVLQGLAQLGQNSAAQTGAYGTTTAANIGATTVGAANARAAGTIGSANAVAGGMSGLSNAYLYNKFFNSNNSGMYATGTDYSQLQPYSGISWGDLPPT